MPGPHNILIVEDEPLIAMMLEDFLEMLDRQLAGSADNVAAALDLIAAGGIDAAILDVNLRGGEQSWPIADKLAELGIPFVLATGGSGDSVAEAHRDRPVLSKPFTMDAVEKALDALG
ncbi:response regulator [Sphingomonas sp. AOB5]|uniref:response regulator n=1 Tax=Sphingomonas sp. AOB5 TaxID=3034017 RepID=UPI0023F981B3|nr:response regulator [Sphingomonas sp. AOB5]MDF7774468.1 response regulator [Sphingomonas sp. AOB5]